MPRQKIDSLVKFSVNRAMWRSIQKRDLPHFVATCRKLMAEYGIEPVRQELLRQAKKPDNWLQPEGAIGWLGRQIEGAAEENWRIQNGFESEE